MMREWLDQNGPFLELLHQAANKPTYAIPLVSVGGSKALYNSVDLEHQQMQRTFARMLQNRAQYRVATGDIDGAVRDILACKRIGRYLQCRGMIGTRVMGVAVEGIADAIGIAVTNGPHPTAEQLKWFVEEINAIPQRPGLEETLLAERYNLLDLIQAMAWGDQRDSDGVRWEGTVSMVPTSVSIDWNVALHSFNASYGVVPEAEPPGPSVTSFLSGLFLSGRSRHMGHIMSSTSLTFVRLVREVDSRHQCIENLHQITLAMLRYAGDHGTLPPAYTTDAEGRPLQSWRVLLLPYLGQEDLFRGIHLDEPWDSPHNRQFHNAVPAVYRCPNAELTAGQTAYSVVVGERAPFGPGEGRALDKFGMHMVLVVERQKPVGWLQPDSELTEAVAMTGINSKEPGFDGVGSRHPSISNVGLRDGSARQYGANTKPSHWQCLLERTANSNDD